MKEFINAYIGFCYLKQKSLFAYNMQDMAALANSSPSKNVRANVVINLIRTLTMTILSFITFPYITRALGDASFGLYTWANTFVYYFLILAKISIPNLAIRECTKVKDDKELLNKRVQEFFIIQAIMTLFSFALMCMVVFSVESLFEAKELIFILSINFLAGVFSFEWLYIVLEKHFYITVRSISLIALSALLVFLNINSKANESGYSQYYVHLYAAITISSTVLTSIINMLLLPRYVSLRKTCKYDFKPLIKPLITLFLISLAITLYNQTDEFILGFIDKSKAAVGAYSVGVKGVDIIITLITSLYAVFMPRANYYYQKENKVFYQNLINYSLNITFFVAIPAIATMATMANEITSLISGSYDGSGYSDARWMLVSLAIMMLTYSIGDNIYTEILLPMKKEKTYLYTMLLGVLFNVGFSFLFALVFMPSRPGLGVAIATGATDFLILLYLMYATRQYSAKAIFNLNNLKIVAAGIIIAVISIFVAPLIEKALPYQGNEIWINYIITLVSVVLLDAIIYIGILLLSKENLVSSFLPSHRKKMEEQING